MAPSNAKNLDYLIPLVQREAIMAGLLLPPGAKYPDGSPIGQPFPRIPVPKGLRVGTGWRIRTEGQTITPADLVNYEHPYDSGQEIHQHLTNYEKIQIPLTRWAGMDGRDKDHIMGTTAPDDLDAEIGFGLREVLYASVEQRLATNLTTLTNYTANATPGPGFCVNCVAAPWTNPLIDPINDPTSGLITALRSMFVLGKYPDGILMDLASWAALTGNPLAQAYVRPFIMMTAQNMGEGATLTRVSVQAAIKIDPYPAVEVFLGAGSYMGTLTPDGLYDASEITQIWPQGYAIIYCRGGIKADRLRGQAFCVVNDGGDEFDTSTEAGFSTLQTKYRYVLYSGHNVIDWTNATLLYALA